MKKLKEIGIIVFWAVTVCLGLYCFGAIVAGLFKETILRFATS